MSAKEKIMLKSLSEWERTCLSNLAKRGRKVGDNNAHVRKLILFMGKNAPSKG